MEQLKRTRSICPECFKEVDAEVYIEGNTVLMRKTCPKHGEHRVVLERNAEFYIKAMNKDYNKGKARSECLMVPFTHKCNLNCKMCYLPYKNKDLPLDFFKRVINNFEGSSMRISGGEPTLRKDLPELLSYISKKGLRYDLVTNGLKFADELYLKNLKKKSGLDQVHFSLNALNDKVLGKIDGCKAVNSKLKGLENLKKHGVKVVLSTMLLRGVNEPELKKIFDYYLENDDSIVQWRLRSGVQIGRYKDAEPFSVSELIYEICKATGIDAKGVIKDFNKKRNVNAMPCKFTLYLFFYKNGNDSYLLFPEVNHKDMALLFHSGFKKFVFGYKLVKHKGIGHLARYLKDKKLNKGKIRVLTVEIRSWPTKHTVDLGEVSYCASRNLAEDGKVYPFCYSFIINDHLAKGSVHAR